MPYSARYVKPNHNSRPNAPVGPGIRQTGTKPGLLARIVGAKTRLQMHNALQGYLFLLPWLVGLLVFFGGPVLACVILGFTEYDILSVPRFVGFDNYSKAFFDDYLFWPSLGRTLYFACVGVPISLFGSLILAILLNQRLKGTNLFRMIFFVPHLMPIVAVAIIWFWILHPKLGPVNAYLAELGLPGPGWFTSRTWVMPSMILVYIWMAMGGNRMLIFLAGLQGVPDELYEAAKLDGAGAFKRFRHVTLPMISPTILFNVVLGVVGAMKVFGLVFATTKGGPAYGSWVLALHIYEQAFEYFRFGYGSALAWIFAVILLTFTVIQLKASGRWVFYAGAG